jgi:cellulose synthase/poly-beta-1,6-N-acetylglucosamine synthase-like glycosyltransferase
VVTVVTGAFLVLVQTYALLYLLYLWLPACASLLSALRPERANPNGLVRKQRRFLVLISAHNEEVVVGELLRSLAAQAYPASHLQVYVVANNCTDNTAAVVRASQGAMCLQRTTGDAATKGVALGWLWERVADTARDVDCVLVLDADNLTPPEFLSELNRTFEAGYRVVQSARCAKNASDSMTSQLDAISEALWNRLDQAGRSTMGLSATIAGSGMAFDRDVFAWLIGEGGPGLLEDIEWQARLMLAGIAVGYTARARVYDEKTRRASSLGRQRKRWVAGVAIAARRYGWRLFATGLRNASLQQLVAAFAVTKPPRSVLLGLMGLLAVLGALFPAAPLLLPWPFWLAALGSFAAYVLLGMALDGVRPAAYLALLGAPVFVVMMMGTTLVGVLRASKQRWVPTAHERGIALEHVRSD